MNANIVCHKKLNPIVPELFIRGRKLNISLDFITLFLCCTKNYETKFYTVLYYETLQKAELQQIAYSHSTDIGFKDFINLQKNILKNHNLFSD